MATTTATLDVSVIDAAAVRARVAAGDRGAFKAALAAVDARDRDAFVDAVCGTAVVDDGPGLPPGCVPYLPAPVDALLRLVETVPFGADDVFVDVGAGVGRAAVVVHLLTGVRAVSVEAQPALVDAARAVASGLALDDVEFVCGDALSTPVRGTVFFLYCPFSGARLARFVDGLRALDRPFRLCALDVPLPPRPWLTVERAWHDLVVCRAVVTGATV